MIIKCSNCQTGLRLDESKLKAGSYNIKCPKCSSVNQAIIPAKEPEAVVPNLGISTEANPKEVGWLIVHDENTESQVFPLKLGKNIVGRWSESKPCDVMIETEDRRMSRNHSVVEVLKRPTGQYDYLIYDFGSANGTFINADANKRLTEHDQVFLRDGDTIQMGRTKMVLKTIKVVANAASASQEVKKQGHKQTIAI